MAGVVPLVLGAGAVFGALTLAATELLGSASSDEAPRRSARQVLSDISAATERCLVQRGWQERLDDATDSAGLVLTAGELCVRVGVGVLVALLLGWLVAGTGTALLLAMLVPVGAWLLVRRLGERRRVAFGEQVVQLLPSLAGSLRAGHSLIQAIELGGDELDAPAGPELRRVAAEINLGRDQVEALTAMADRFACEDLAWLVSSVEIHREVGGDLTLVLERVAETIRARDHLKRQVQVLTAEGRASAKVLGLLPIFAFGLMALIDPQNISAFTGSALGITLLLVAAGLLSIAWVWMRILTRGGRA